jgi:hypothetical protein
MSQFQTEPQINPFGTTVTVNGNARQADAMKKRIVMRQQ